MIESVFGYLFGMGDAAAILEQEVDAPAKRPILSFRPSDAADSLTEALIKHIRNESHEPTIEGENIADCPDYLAFVCEQLNLSRVIDEHFLGPNGLAGFHIKGASIRNLNILAAFVACSAISIEAGSRIPPGSTNVENADRGWLLLERALGMDPESSSCIRPLPVSYDQGIIWAKYSEPIPQSEIERLQIPSQALAEANHLVYGQSFIDQIVHPGMIIDFGLVGSIKDSTLPLPRPNFSYITALRSAKLIVMGAGSLFSSQLAQLAVPGVVDEILRKRDARRVLVVNHVCMNETSSYSLTDHIKAIERLANAALSDRVKQTLKRTVRIGDLFTDIIVPRTVAREIDIALGHESAGKNDPARAEPQTRDVTGKPIFVAPNGTPATQADGIYYNRYVEYVLTHPEFRDQHQITDWEVQVLGFLDQPPFLGKSRSEAGRYRGAVYAHESDIDYLIRQGISRRHIYEVESIAMNEKILKAEGKPKIERFPGLIPESLVGIFKILLEKGTISS
jgi:hypothetical protein